MVTPTAGYNQYAVDAYEHYIRENWERLSPFEQEQARAYMHSKFLAASAGVPQFQAQSSAPDWTVPAGYICAGISMFLFPIIFAPAALGLGIYNGTKGRAGHATAQIILAIVCGMIGFILGALIWAGQN